MPMIFLSVYIPSLMAYITFGILIFLSLFHIYLTLNLPINKAAILPKINGRPLPFHSLAAFPVAILLFLSSLAFANQAELIPIQLPQIFLSSYLWLTAFGFISRGLFGFIVFHILNKVIDNTPFKVWDLKLYSPLTLFLGLHCLIILI